jgi:hypothetical protein
LIIRSGDADSKEKLKVWRTAEKNFGKRKDVLTYSLDQPNRYCWSSGFWADTNYLIDAPINLKDGFDQKVEALYAEVKSQLENERSACSRIQTIWLRYQNF